MAQAMLDKKKLKIFSDISTQTESDYFFNLSPSKHGKIYYSKCYKSNILSLNINRSKAFVITPQIWKIIKSKSHIIDEILKADV